MRPILYVNVAIYKLKSFVAIQCIVRQILPACSFRNSRPFYIKPRRNGFVFASIFCSAQVRIETGSRVVQLSYKNPAGRFNIFAFWGCREKICFGFCALRK